MNHRAQQKYVGVYHERAEVRGGVWLTERGVEKRDKQAGKA